MASSLKPHTPGTLRIRAATISDVPAIARVHVDAWRETYPGVFPQTVLDALSSDEREAQWLSTFQADTSCLIVAEVGGVVVGFASGGLNRDSDYAGAYPGELQTIYLLKAHQRLGLGQVLFESVREWLTSHGLGVFMLWVAAENPGAHEFYRKLGGTWIVTRTSDIRGAQIAESAYGWR